MDAHVIATSAASTQHQQGIWLEFAGATTSESFCHAWLALLCRQMTDVTGALVLLGPADTGPYTPAAAWPRPQRELEYLSAAAERAVTERRGVVVEGVAEGSASGGHHLHLAYPLEVSGRLHGVVVVQANPRPSEAVQALLQQVHWGIAWLETLIWRQSSAEQSTTLERVFTALNLAATVVEEQRFKGGATALVTELATHLGCDRVSLGLLHRGRLRIEALSHSATFSREMDLVRSLEAAMTEAVDQQATVLYPQIDESSNLITRAHETLCEQQGTGSICSVPITLDERFAAALTLERPPGRSFDKNEVELCETLAALTVPVLDLKRDQERWIGLKLVRSVIVQLGRLFGPRYLGRKLITGVAVVALAALILLHGTYRITAHATLEGAVVRTVAAPFDGYIASAEYRAGDTVEAGTVLASLDDRDLKVERMRLATERAQHERERREAAAKHERARVRILTAEIQQAEAQLALIDERLDRMRLTAPFDGVLVMGDLSQSLGAPVQKGDALFEIAPLSSYRLAMQVDERDIRDVREGENGKLVLGALPQQPFDFRVTLITPVTNVADGRNVFRVEGILDSTPSGLRPGMEGIAKIDAGERQLLSIWTRSLWQWLLLKIWAWSP